MHELRKFLFPMRYHLLEEVAYLRQQLAQKQRRVDELQDALVEIRKPQPKAVDARTPAPYIPLKPHGWEAFRKKKQQEIYDAEKESATTKGGDDQVGDRVFQPDTVGEVLSTGLSEKWSEDPRHAFAQTGQRAVPIYPEGWDG